MNETTERDALLTAYLAGELDRAGTEQVRERLASSPDWQAALAALQPGWEQCQQHLPPAGAPRALSATRQAAILRAASEALPASEPPALAAEPTSAPPAIAHPAAPAAAPTKAPLVMSTPPTPSDAPPSPRTVAARPWQMWVQVGAAAAVMVTLLVVWLNSPPPSAGPMASHQPAEPAAPPAVTPAPMAAPAELAATVSADTAPAREAELAAEVDAAKNLTAPTATMATPPAAPAMAGAARMAMDGAAMVADDHASQAPPAPMAPPTEQHRRKLEFQAETSAAPGAALPMSGAAGVEKRHELAAAKAPQAGHATSFGALTEPAPAAAQPPPDAMLLPLPQAPLAPELWERVQLALLAGEPVAPADLAGPLLLGHLAQAGMPTSTAPIVILEMYRPTEDPRVVLLMMAARAPLLSVDEPWHKLTEAATKAANADKLAMTSAVLSLSLSPLVEAWRRPGGEWQKPAGEYRTPSTQHRHNDAASQAIELRLVPEADGRVATLNWQWQEPGLTQVKQMAAEVSAPASHKPGRLTRLYELANDFLGKLREHGGQLPAAEATVLRQQWRPLDRSRTVHDQAVVDQIGRILLRDLDPAKGDAAP